MKTEIKTTLIGAAAGVVGGTVVVLGDYLVTKREADVKMIEIAVGILAAKPDQNIKPARAWAVDVLDHYSTDVKLTDEVKAALLDNPLPVRTFRTLWGSGVFGEGTLGASPEE